MPRQPLNVVILGGSFAGLAVAHHFLDRIVHQLSTFEGAPAYRVVLVSPSTHLYWNICAPRVLVSPSLISPEDAFIPIEPAFARHPFDKFTFMQGWATGVDTSAKKVTIELVRNVKENRLSGVSKASSSTAETNPANISTVQTISYHALVLATGSSTYSPLYSLHGTHEDTLAELRAFHRRLETAHSVMIVGGGPSGVETAGQLATYYNQKRRWRTFKEKRHRSDTTITLLSGGARLLPKLPPTVSKKAERKLKKLGVHIVHNLREIGNTTNADGTTNCILNNDMTITSDVLISATGVYPNTRFLPQHMLDENGYVITDPQTLRVYAQGVGQRVYAVGDCANYSKNYTLDVYEAVPILMKNLQNDLLTHEYKLQTVTSMPHGEAHKTARQKIAALEDAHYHQNPTDSQLMPITRFGGVGVIFDWRIPSFLVYLMKGRKYRLGRAEGAVGRGRDPYAVR
ncbi:FAD/NAD(P)-binding domain-containing protein [Trematosphaeria pertusa]|uniref:FAD/NAD(P)-binding domain-containing protein n=1 Tax=Trematosphaeria pertusa TaxID=390896 RepID=A0A6A6I689_9PLEO|nr:FAD/NAD(P)-binding domain-containing protein [Trematosphaeria pertusa]KAF2246064.1 FAD/NAD(P)-binding domain-containing protein [Trematosphaeria pertusa]